jgi:nicotinamide-nucleotide amidase
MIIESLAIGDELLRGEVVDTNSAYLGAALLRAGLRLARTRTLGDEEDEICAELSAAAKRASAVVVSGGLGPTVDDRTASAAGRVFGRPLELHAPTLERMRALFAARGYTLSSNNEKQAWVPRGATVIENPVGTAPAFVLEEGGAELFFLPGVPREYRCLLDEAVLPRVLSRRGRTAVRSRVLHTLGATESRVDHLLREVPLGNVKIHFRVEGPETHVILVAEAPEAAEAETALARADAEVGSRLGDLVYGRDADTLAALLGEELALRGWTIGIAESCTGGLVAAELTSVPGSSRYFRTGIVAYANETKSTLLGVPEEILRRHGAVSEETARAMAQGIRTLAKSEVGVAVTGIAGPEGGTAEKPVGLVHIAAAGAREVHRRILLPPGRDRVRAFSARIALKLALESLVP